MKFTIVNAALLFWLSATSGVMAKKCACNGGSEKSEAACKALGHRYSYNSCGFTGCCLTESDIPSFKAKCNSLGFGFKRCDDCGTCS